MLQDIEQPWNIKEHQLDIDAMLCSILVPHNWGRKPASLKTASVWKGITLSCLARPDTAFV